MSYKSCPSNLIYPSNIVLSPERFPNWFVFSKSKDQEWDFNLSYGHLLLDSDRVPKCLSLWGLENH